jgi:lysophospholipase L1-like esterase
MLADGLKRGINKPHNWARLAQRLSTPGANITVAALGGSITAGYGLTNRKQSWAYQFVGWLQEAFPEVTISFKHNLGRDGIQINLASTCW